MAVTLLHLQRHRRANQMVAFQLDIVEILFHGPHMIACCALGNVRQPLQHRVVDPRMLAIDLLFCCGRW